MEFFCTTIAEDAIARVVDVLRRGWVSEGETVKAFEGALTRECGLRHPVVLNSGTSALHLALALAGVGRGDEVIIPAQTFVATALAVLMQGATPVFADIQVETGNVDPESIRQRVTVRTRAIMPVHWGGYPCDLDEIDALAREQDLAVIEDAAHALGATYRGRPIGSISRFTAFSFQAIKHITTGDGGALACTDAEDARQARIRRWFGIDRANSHAGLLGEREFEITELGYKYHLNDLAAAVGLGNLSDLGRRLDRRAAIAGLYRAALQGVPGVTLLAQQADRTSASWLFTMRVDRRDDFVRALAARDVPASVVHRRIDRLRICGGVRDDLPRQAQFDAEQIAIPLHDQLTDDDVARVVEAVRTGW